MISENLRRCVCFVYRTRQGDTLRTPFGTAFLVVVIEQAAGTPLPVWYAVTASHVVSPVDMRGESHDLYLRWPHRAGEADQFEPIDPDKWQRHPDADLAITRVRRSDLVASNQQPRAYWPIFSTQLAGADHLLRPEVGEGDTVFMVGLFSSHPGSQQPQPIYRFGNVALMPREPVTIALPGGVRRNIEAYLIEAHSWGGQSGSPVFIASTHHMIHDQVTLDGTTVSPIVLGFLQGHFDIDTAPKIEQSDAEQYGYESAIAEMSGVKVPVNAGIAIVVPAERITEMLMRDEFVEDRLRGVREAEKFRRQRPDV